MSPVAMEGDARGRAARSEPDAAAQGMRDAVARTPAELRGDPNPGLFRGSLHAVYDVAWYAAIVVALPWLLYRSLRDRAFGRMVLERLGVGLARRGPSRRPRVLVHGVSVGEVKAAVPLVHGIEERYPELEVVVSATTDTGLEVARRLLPGRSVVRFPADLAFVVKRFLRRVEPEVVLLVELEIWPNFLRICNRRGVPVSVVNGRITTMSHGHYLFFRDVLPQFNRISLYCVQLDEYGRRFRALGVDPARIRVTGNVKVDGLPVGRVDPGDELRRLVGAPGGRPVVVAGSTHEPEETLVARAWRASFHEARLVLVPRHPHRCREVAETLRGLSIEVQTLSALRAGAEPPDPARPLLVDTIGELERIYGLADAVFVGGSLVPHGGQNMLEPAAQGCAVLFGPSVENFAQEVFLLRQAEACVALAGPEALGPEVARLLADGAERERLGRAAMGAVAAQGGATRATLDLLHGLSLARVAHEARA